MREGNKSFLVGENRKRNTVGLKEGENKIRRCLNHSGKEMRNSKVERGGERTAKE